MNTVCPLSKEQVDELMEKAKELRANNKRMGGWKAMRSSPENGVRKGDGMFIEFIICLRIYCSFSNFCTKFRSSFRKLKYDDTEDTIRERHIDNFYWFGRYLECALMLYGRKPKRKQIFYHGLDGQFLFDSFSAVFEIPLSTTNDTTVAQRFTEDSGVILCFSLKFKLSQNTSYYLSISGSGLSDYNETEYLFAGDAILAITDLIVMGSMSEPESYKTYMKCFLYWERILEQTNESRKKYAFGVISEKTKGKWMTAQRECLVPLIKRRMHLLDDEDKEKVGPPLYIMRLFNHFCDRKSSVNLSCIRMEMEFMEKSLREIVFKKSDDGEYVVNIDSFSVILPNCREYVNENGVSNVISMR